MVCALVGLDAADLDYEGSAACDRVRRLSTIYRTRPRDGRVLGNWSSEEWFITVFSFAKSL